MLKQLQLYLNRPGLGPKLVKASTGSAGLRVASMLFGFLSGVQLARGLGADGYGVYGLAMSVIAIMSVVTEFGLPQLLTREVATAQVHQQWERVRGILVWSTRLVLLTSALSLVLAIGWLYVSDGLSGSEFGWTLLTGVLLVPLVAEGKIRAAALRGMQFIVRSQIPETLLRPALFAILLFVVSWWTPLQPHLAMGLGVVSAAASLLLSVFMLRASLPSEVGAAKPQFDARIWWSSAVPMAMAEGMRVLQVHLSVLVLGWLATAATVGEFRVASSIAVLLAFPLTLFALVGSPIIARLHAQKKQQQLQRLLSWMSVAMTVSAALGALPFVLFGEALLSSIFGGEFSGSNTILLVLCLSALLTGCFGLNAVLLNMTGHSKSVAHASMISLILSTSLTPLSVSYAGGIGAAWANAFSLLIWNVVMWRDGIRNLSLDSTFWPLLRKALVGRLS